MVIIVTYSHSRRLLVSAVVDQSLTFPRVLPIFSGAVFFYLLLIHSKVSLPYGYLIDQATVIEVNVLLPLLWNHFSLCQMTVCGFFPKFSVVSHLSAVLFLHWCCTVFITCFLMPDNFSPSILFFCNSTLATLYPSPFHIHFRIIHTGKILRAHWNWTVLAHIEWRNACLSWVWNTIILMTPCMVLYRVDDTDEAFPIWNYSRIEAWEHSVAVRMV